MVLLIMTRAGFDDMRSLVTPSGHHVWVDRWVLSDEEIQMLRERGVDLNCFTRPHTLAQALDVVAQHHPTERIWVETSVESQFAP